jgi:plastocyanin
VSVIVRDYDFSPSTVVLKPGESVRVTASNQGSVAHSLTFTVGDLKVDLLLNPRDTKSTPVFRIPAEGQYGFLCQFHPPEMVGTFLVTTQSVTPTPAPPVSTGGGYDY